MTRTFYSINFLFVCALLSTAGAETPRITPTDVLEAQAHTGCAGPTPVADSKPMPETTPDERLIAQRMTTFRGYRDKPPSTPNVILSGSGQGRIREVMPAYFQIELG